MTIPESVWIKYINLLAAIDRTAAKKLTAYLNMHDVSGKQGRKSAIDYAYGITTKYGESSAAVACEMYDAVAAASGVNVPAAEPAPTPDYGEVAKAYNGMVKQGLGNDAIGDGISRLVRRTGADTTRNNALRDGAEFAWVPHGDTCSFCIMLASNGWQKASKKTISGDHADHIHPNCDCTFAIRFDGKSNVAGYDPDKYREMYDNAEGNTWREKLNSMQREAYAREKYIKELNKKSDPIFDIYGAASKSHPEEIKRIISEAEKMGVEIREGSGRMAYAPGILPGQPGQLYISKDDSIGAWLHEERHMLDDMADGWPGFRGLKDIDRRSEMEYNAYMEEIKIAKDAEREDIVKKLIKDYNKEIQSFGGDTIDIAGKNK